MWTVERSEMASLAGLAQVPPDPGELGSQVSPTDEHPLHGGIQLVTHRDRITLGTPSTHPADQSQGGSACRQLNVYSLSKLV